MKPIVKLIVENESSLLCYTSQLESVFGDALEVRGHWLGEEAAYENQGESIILTSANSAENFSEFRRRNRSRQPLLTFNLALQRRSLVQLNAYAKGSRFLVGNVSRFMAEETITQLCQAGYGHLQFFPYYPGRPDRPQADLGLTVGEMECLPQDLKERIDLGPRQIDIASIIELAVKLDLEYTLYTRRFFRFFEKQYNPSSGISLLVQRELLLEQRQHTLLQLFEQGLIGLDQEGGPFFCNFRAAALSGHTREEILQGAPVLPQNLVQRCAALQAPVFQTCGGENPYEVSMTPILYGTQYLGAYAVLRPAQTVRPPALPEEGRHGGHLAKYRFADICGNSPRLRRTVELARKMARTDSSVLITGESGTGKELFAHAIHNSSPRAEAPFVAINCAALPDTLLESELFGYEEGAFTGAKKGGKIGLFELANGGCIFLDEVEGMAPSTQLKLLRVIQEREMIRVGGEQVIPIDVRIISASNEDLLSLIQAGKFRRDLYYRLGTLPLDLPPLRQRREDILPLMETFKSALGLDFRLTEEAKNCLLRYSWPGNIRELHNCVEYLGCQNLPVIEPDSLPHTIFEQQDQGQDPMSREEMETLLLRRLAGGSCGRMQLQKFLSQAGCAVKEAQLRRTLEQMKARGWIASGTGRGGSSITELGKQEYKNRSKQD